MDKTAFLENAQNILHRRHHFPFCCCCYCGGGGGRELHALSKGDSLNLEAETFLIKHSCTTKEKEREREIEKERQ